MATTTAAPPAAPPTFSPRSRRDEDPSVTLSVYADAIPDDDSRAGESLPTPHG